MKLNTNFVRGGTWLGLLLAAPAFISAAEWSGSLAIESRIFQHSPIHAGQDSDAAFSASFQPEFYHEWDRGAEAFEFTPLFRWDEQDPERDLIDVQELSLLLVRGDWEWKFGVSKIFWGVAESQHLVDVINQTDSVANPDGEDKLGQPMIELTRVTRSGDLSLYILPYFRERTFPGQNGRLRPPLFVNTDLTTYESNAEESHVDLALRWKMIVGDFDIGLHYFRGTNRDPVLTPIFNRGAPSYFIPHYEQMDQIGLDLQYTKEGWLWKLEALARDSASDRYSAMTGGFEYTFYGVFGTAIDAGALAEIHLDSRGENAPVPFNRDLFAGVRLGWNDEADTSLVFGTFVDADNGSLFGRVEFERRVGRSHKLEVQIQKLANIAPRDPMYPLRRDSYLQIGLSRHF